MREWSTRRRAERHWRIWCWGKTLIGSSSGFASQKTGGKSQILCLCYNDIHQHLVDYQPNDLFLLPSRLRFFDAGFKILACYSILRCFSCTSSCPCTLGSHCRNVYSSDVCIEPSARLQGPEILITMMGLVDLIHNTNRL